MRACVHVCVPGLLAISLSLSLLDFHLTDSLKLLFISSVSHGCHFAMELHTLNKDNCA